MNALRLIASASALLALALAAGCPSVPGECRSNVDCASVEVCRENACVPSSTGGGNDDGGLPIDAGFDGGNGVDAGTDAGNGDVDAGTDAGGDPTDAGDDTDAGTDAGDDGTDAGDETDAGNDAGDDESDAGADAGDAA